MNTITQTNKSFKNNSLGNLPTDNVVPHDSDISLNNFVFFDFMTLVRSGFYEIKHIPSGKRYIGETQNLLERLGKHVAILQKGVHDCLPLQNDWDKEKNAHNLKNTFSLKVFDCVPLDDPKLRKKKELDYLLTQNSVTLYNVLHNKNLPKVKKQNFRRIIHVNGVDYQSIRQAALALHMGETTIRRWINNPNLESCYIKQTVKHGYHKCIVNGVEYPSVISLVDAGLAPTSLFATRRLSSPNFTNWYYLQTDKHKKNLRSVQKKNFAKPCIVEGITYPSVKALVTAGVATSRNFAERRLKSAQFPDWQYM